MRLESANTFRLRQRLSFLLALSIAIIAQAQIPKGVRTIDYNSAMYPIYGLSMDKNGKSLLVSAYGGRFYMLQIDDKPSRSAFSQKESQTWTRILSNDFKWGAKPKFSPNGTSILLKPMYDNPNLVKIKPTALVILDKTTGNTLYDRQDVLSADYVTDDLVLVSTEAGLEWIELSSKTVIKKLEMPEVEAIAVSPEGNHVAISFVPDKQQFATLQSINFRKRELKIANRGKRLLAVYELSSMKPISIVDDEIDIVFRMKYSNDQKSIVLFTRNFKSKSGTKKADVRQENTSKLLDLNMIKVDIETGEIDKNFYYSTNYIHSDFDVSEGSNLFAFSSSGMVSGSLFKTQNGLEIYDFNLPDKLLYSLKTRFKWFKKLATPYQFVLIPGQTKCYVGSGADLVQWDYSVLPEHVFNAEGGENDAIISKAFDQLDSLTKTADFKKYVLQNKIQGVYVYDITVFKKGTVSTVFSQTDEGMDIPAHNSLLDYIRNLKFKELDIPKDKRVKFQYTFEIESTY